MPEGGRLGRLCESCQNPQTVMIICQDLLCDKNAYLGRFKSQSVSLCQHFSLPISDVSAVNSHFPLIALTSQATFWTQACVMFWSEWASKSSEKAGGHPLMSVLCQSSCVLSEFPGFLPQSRQHACEVNGELLIVCTGDCEYEWLFVGPAVNRQPVPRPWEQQKLSQNVEGWLIAIEAQILMFLMKHGLLCAFIESSSITYWQAQQTRSMLSKCQDIEDDYLDAYIIQTKMNV